MRTIAYLVALFILADVSSAQEEKDPCSAARFRVAANIALSKVTKFVAPESESQLIFSRDLVLLRARIDSNGKISQVSVTSGRPIPTQRAMDAVRQWQYTPFLRRGHAVPVCFDIQVPVNKDHASPLAEVIWANRENSNFFDSPVDYK